MDADERDVNLELVRAVRDRPVIYDTRLQEHRSRRKRAEAWEEVARIIGSTKKRCKKRWNELWRSYEQNIAWLNADPNNGTPEETVLLREMEAMCPILNMIKQSSQIPVKELSPSDRITALEENLRRINHYCDNLEQTIDADMPLTLFLADLDDILTPVSANNRLALVRVGEMEAFTLDPENQESVDRINSSDYINIQRMTRELEMMNNKYIPPEDAEFESYDS